MSLKKNSSPHEIRTPDLAFRRRDLVLYVVIVLNVCNATSIGREHGMSVETWESGRRLGHQVVLKICLASSIFE